jgi:hypothetical protein
MGHVARQNYFVKKDQGFVRFINKKQGTFVLDPEPDLPTVKNDLYVMLKQPFPEPRAFIKVNVRESEPFRELVGRNQVKVTNLKYVFDWERVNVCDMLKPIYIPGFEDVDMRGLQQEDFLEFMSLSIKRKYLTPEIQYSLCLYAVASPEVSDYQKGGINTTVLANFEPLEKWSKFKKLSGVIPTEYRKPTSVHFYKNVEYNSYSYKLRTNPETGEKYTVVDTDLEFHKIKAREISLAYHNNMAEPVEVPLPLNVEFRTLSDINNDLRIDFAAGRNFLMDSLLIEPEIPEEEHRHLLDKIYEFSDGFRGMGNDFKYAKDALRISSHLLRRLALAFARFDYSPVVTREHMQEAIDLWMDLQGEVVKMGFAGQKYRGFYNLLAGEKIVFGELVDMRNTGIETTVQNLRAITKVNLKDIDDILAALVRKHFIYFINRDKIGFIED